MLYVFNITCLIMTLLFEYTYTRLFHVKGTLGERLANPGVSAMLCPRSRSIVARQLTSEPVRSGT